MIPMTAPVTAVIERETTLDHLARDIEREICGIDNAAHEAQVAREDIGLVGDEVAMRRAGVDTGMRSGSMPRSDGWRSEGFCGVIVGAPPAPLAPGAVGSHGTWAGIG
jgi:hypothetical protein